MNHINKEKEKKNTNSTQLISTQLNQTISPVVCRVHTSPPRRRCPAGVWGAAGQRGDQHAVRTAQRGGHHTHHVPTAPGQAGRGGCGGIYTFNNGIFM